MKIRLRILAQVAIVGGAFAMLTWAQSSMTVNGVPAKIGGNLKAAQVSGLAASATTDTTNPANISPGSVSSTEFGFLDGVTSAIQTQLGGKLSTSGVAADTSKVNGASVPVSKRTVGTNSSGQLIDTGATFIYPCNPSGTSSSPPTAYACTTGYSITPTTGTMILLRPDRQCSGQGATVNVDGFGAQQIYGIDQGLPISANVCATEGFGDFSNFMLMVYSATSSNGWYLVNYIQGASFSCGTAGTLVFAPSTSNTGFQCVGGTTATANGKVSIKLISGNTGAPAISGCSATIGTGSTNSSGFFTSGTTGTCTVVITWSSSLAFTTGVNCHVWDQTTVPTLFTGLMAQTAQNTTTVTFSGTTVSGDRVNFGPCIGF